MTTMVSKMAHEYPYGTKRKKGEEFEVEDSAHVHLLATLGRAQIKEVSLRDTQSDADPAPSGRKSSRRASALEN